MGKRIEKGRLFDFLVVGILFVIIGAILTTIITMIFSAIGSIALVEGGAIFGVIIFFAFLLVIFIVIGWLVFALGEKFGRMH
jgi:hypothetical protein